MPLTTIRVVENKRVEEEAEKALFLAEGALLVPMQFGVIEGPLGYIVVDHEGGHLKIPQEADDRIKMLVWDRNTNQPVAENPVTIKHVLKHYCTHTMPVADFIMNRDGMEERWRQLVTTMVSAGIDVEQDRARRLENNTNRIITGGALPLAPLN